MTTRHCHYLTRPKSAVLPSSYLFVDTETLPRWVPASVPTVVHRFRLGVAIAVRMEGTEVTRRQVYRFSHPVGFWEFLKSRLDRRRPLHVVAHSLPFDFRVLGGWDVLRNYNLEKWRLVLKDPPTILKGQMSGKSVTYLDSLNYYPAKLEEIGRDIGLLKGVMPPYTASNLDWWDYCERDTEIVEKAILGLRQYIIENDLGSMGRTISQTSLNTYRYRFMPTDIAIHADQEIMDLERSCYYGGQAECFYVGSVREKVYELDVNSLYPYVMKHNRFPCRLAKTVRNQPVSEAIGYLDGWAGCAQVVIDQRERTYPVRRGGDPVRRPDGTYEFPDHGMPGHFPRPYYADGCYRTWLCGPELECALRSGHVYTIERAAWYETADLFSEFVDHFYAERMRYKLRGQSALELTSKMILNSLSGIWAKRAPKYIAADDVVPPLLWGHFFIANSTNRGPIPARAIAGITQEETGKTEGYNSFTAISAFITSYGREYMRRLRQLAGEANVYYQDTDSLMVNEYGYDRLVLSGKVRLTELGALKVKGESSVAEFRGIKDYQLGDKEVLKGIGPGCPRDEFGAYLKWRFDRLQDAIISRGTDQVAQRMSTIRLQRRYKKGEVQDTGYVLPLTLFAHPGLM